MCHVLFDVSRCLHAECDFLGNLVAFNITLLVDILSDRDIDALTLSEQNVSSGTWGVLTETGRYINKSGCSVFAGFSC